jgi:endonuclease/exonuclease/phosphatase family metal-dependent hydrolase
LDLPLDLLNSGGVYRNTDVDIEPSSNGSYDVGWTASGEWLNYTVNVTANGSYTVQLLVASMGGGLLHVGFNGPSTGVWQAVTIPDTGGWQNWTTVNLDVNLNAGLQQITMLFDTGGINVDAITVTQSAGNARPPSTDVGVPNPVVLTWNLDMVEPGNDGGARATAAMDAITSLNDVPQIIILEEALYSQFPTYLAELQNRTGLAWDGIFAAHCALGGWMGSWCSANENEGVAVLTSFPMVDSSTTYLPFADDWHSARAVARAAVSVSGWIVQVFGAHMSNTPSARQNMMTSLIAYAQSFPVPQIVGGDFNADPDQIDQGYAMGGAFQDAWAVVGSGPGYTCTTPEPTMHLDYLFEDYTGDVRPLWAVVLTQTGTFSDHFPVLGAFTLQ